MTTVLSTCCVENIDRVWLRRWSAISIITAILAILVSGCANLPKPTELPAEGSKTPQPAVKAPESPVTAEAPASSAALTEAVMYKILVAEVAGQRGRLDVALENYTELARDIPDPQLAKRATQIAIYARDNEATLQAAQRWVELDPDNIEAHQALAAMYVRQGEVDPALGEIEYILANHDGDPEKKFRSIASFVGGEADAKTGYAIMEKLVAKRQDDPDTLLAYALFALRVDKVEKARYAMEKVIDKRPVDAKIALAYLSVLQKQGKIDQALNWLEAIVDQHPENSEIRTLYARMLTDAKRYSEAEQQFKLLLDADPKNADVRYALGLLNLQTEHLEEAKAQFTGLVESGKKVNEASFYLGQIAEKQIEYDTALTWYRAVDPSVDNPDVPIRIAIVLANQKKSKEALAQLAGIKTDGPEMEKRLVQAKGEVLTQLEDYDAALAHYNQELAKGYDADLLYARAILAENMGKLDVLERDLRQILEKDPDNAQVLNALGYTLADQTTRYQEAHDLVKQALELSPNDFFILDSMGWVLYKLGRLEESVEFLKRAKALRDDPEVAAHLGEVLWDMGDKEGARSIWRKALKETPNDEKLREIIQRFKL